MRMTSEILWYPNGGRLVVAMPETGTLIRCETAIKTFVEVIESIGREEVIRAGVTIRGTEVTWMIASNIRLGLNPEGLASKLDEIAERLGISLCIELFP